MAEARDLYRQFFARVREVMDGHFVPGIDTRKFAVLGVLWPSKKFAEEGAHSQRSRGLPVLR